MINVAALRIGDCVGTTNWGPISIPIKIKTWGWLYAFSQNKASHIACVVNEHSLNYFMEMLPGGIHETDIHEYDHYAPRDHICWVGRHSAFDDPNTQQKFNDFMLEAHAHHVKYGYEDLCNFILEKVGFRLKDNQSTLICSELWRAGVHICGVNYPPTWEKDCAPADEQRWPELQNITKLIVG
jgi:hypothetical protein